MQPSLCGLIDGYRLCESMQPGLTLYTSRNRFGAFFECISIRAYLPLSGYFAPPPPVKAGSSTVTDQSSLLDSITR